MFYYIKYLALGQKQAIDKIELMCIIYTSRYRERNTLGEEDVMGKKTLVMTTYGKGEISTAALQRLRENGARIRPHEDGVQTVVTRLVSDRKAKKLIAAQTPS